jgi:hypothetical protein
MQYKKYIICLTNFYLYASQQDEFLILNLIKENDEDINEYFPKAKLSPKKNHRNNINSNLSSSKTTIHPYSPENIRMKKIKKNLINHNEAIENIIYINELKKSIDSTTPYQPEEGVVYEKSVDSNCIKSCYMVHDTMEDKLEISSTYNNKKEKT